MFIQFLSLIFAFSVWILLSHAKKLWQFTKQPHQSKRSYVTKRALITFLLILILVFFPSLSHLWLDSTLSQHQEQQPSWKVDIWKPQLIVHLPFFNEQNKIYLFSHHHKKYTKIQNTQNSPWLKSTRKSIAMRQGILKGCEVFQVFNAIWNWYKNC